MGKITYLTDLFTTRELSAGVLRYCNEVVETNLAGLSDDPLPPCLSPDVSSPISEIALLVLKSLEIPEHDFHDEQPTEAGTRVLTRLHTAIFGHSCSIPQIPTAAGPAFMRHVFAGTSSQAKRAFRLCLAALIDSISPNNALSIFNLASTAACCPLATVAATTALASFSEVSVQDYPGLVHLTESDLLALLSSNDLRVESEVFVFNALIDWVEYDLADRLAGFVGKLATTVRLGQMSIQELAFLDSHPLVSGDRLAVALVANAYLCKLMNIMYENPFGMKGVAVGHRRSGIRSSSNTNNESDMNGVEETDVLMDDVLPPGSNSSSVEDTEASTSSSSSSMATLLCRVAGHVHGSALETVICALRTIQNSQAAATAEALFHSGVKQQQGNLEAAVVCFDALSVNRERTSLFADTRSPSANAAITTTTTTPVERRSLSSTASMMAELLDSVSDSPTPLQLNQQIQQQYCSGGRNLFPVSNKGDGYCSGLQTSEGGISGAENNNNNGVLDNYKENIAPNNKAVLPCLSPVVKWKRQMIGGIAVEQLLSPRCGMKQFQNGGGTQNQPSAENW